jgi:hypothetical protein
MNKLYRHLRWPGRVNLRQLCPPNFCLLSNTPSLVPLFVALTSQFMRKSSSFPRRDSHASITQGHLALHGHLRVFDRCS